MCDVTFFVIAMGSRMVRQQIYQVVSGAEGLANNIAQSAIRELLIVLPPLKEQEDIMRILEHKILKIDSQKQQMNMAIDRLKEYRTALITNAVTGSIDVRNVPIPTDLQEAA
jgi:type I restriction enzyme, S subunit